MEGHGQPRLDEAVRQILARFDVRRSRAQLWRGYLTDLRRILASDYVAGLDAAIHSQRLPLRTLVAAVRERLPDFNRTPLPFAGTIAYARDRNRGLGLNIRVSPFGERGHPLRGFYHAGESVRPLIWVNRQHTPTAISATFAHELGHHFWQSLCAGDGAATRVLLHDGLANHLDDPRELFADVFATLCGYPTETARSLFGRSHWGRRMRFLGSAGMQRLDAIERHVHTHYAGDLGRSSGLPDALRLHYLGSMIHFSKVRAAVLRVAGL